jgi:hypothetical protein
MDDTLKYLQETVGLTGIIKDVPDRMLRKLPMYLSHAYHYSLIEVDEYPFLLAEDRGSIPKTASQLKKQSNALSQYTEWPVVFVLYSPSPQVRRKLIQDRVNFIVPGSQLYLPGLLISLKEINNKPYSFSEQLTPSAQLLLLYHLQVEHLNNFSFKEIAEKLNYSAKTITKIAAELKAKNLCKITGAKEKQFVFDVDREQLWQMSEPQMQSPVTKSYYTNQKSGSVFCKSGDMALAHYTFLSDTGKIEYAVYKAVFDELKENDYWDYLDEVEGNMKVEVWKYDPSLLSDNGYIDALSLYLCYREDSNERVQAEINDLINKKEPTTPSPIR